MTRCERPGRSSDTWMGPRSAPQDEREQNYYQDIVFRISERHVIAVQAAWRGFALRKLLPLIVSRTVLAICCPNILWHLSRSPRVQAKVFIRARNWKIQMIRSRMAKCDPFLHIVARQRFEEELQRLLLNTNHRFRAAMLAQAWWRGCLARGWKGRTQSGQDKIVASFLERMQSIQMDPGSLFDWEAAGRQGTIGGNDAKLQWYGAVPAGVWDALPARASDTLSKLAIDLQSWDSLPSRITWPREVTDEPVVPLPLERLEQIRKRRQARLDLKLPKKVFIFFSDTGGGHRASAQSLQAAFARRYGEQLSVEVVDFIREATPWPWNTAPEGYQYVGAFPNVYKKVYESAEDVSSWCDTKTYKMIWWSSRSSVIKFLLEKIERGVDAIVSVHPLINHMVVEALQEIGGDALRVVPIATVVTDLGSAHLSWFEPRVDALFVPSGSLRQLALRYGVPPAKTHVCGLPVREGFWQADPRPKAQIREELGLTSSDTPELVLVMGGGEGFGALFQVATAIGEMLACRKFGQLVVICGRNEEVRAQLESHNWWSRDARPEFKPTILGFVSNMDELMGAADCLVTKAGPGSIAEAMIKGVPILLTSFVPGQEEGNVTFVTEHGAGLYVPDTEPQRIADVLRAWLREPSMLAEMAQRCRDLARPQAALDIAAAVGEQLLGLGEKPPTRMSIQVT